jgi:hypothetical protein
MFVTSSAGATYDPPYVQRSLGSRTPSPSSPLSSCGVKSSLSSTGVPASAPIKIVVKAASPVFASTTWMEILAPALTRCGEQVWVSSIAAACCREAAPRAVLATQRSAKPASRAAASATRGAVRFTDVLTDRLITPNPPNSSGNALASHWFYNVGAIDATKDLERRP